MLKLVKLNAVYPATSAHRRNLQAGITTPLLTARKVHICVVWCARRVLRDVNSMEQAARARAMASEITPRANLGGHARTNAIRPSAARGRLCSILGRLVLVLRFGYRLTIFTPCGSSHESSAEQTANTQPMSRTKTMNTTEQDQSR